jgi:hypothetical protein
MAGKFSYSFNRETFNGIFETRPEALNKAIEKLNELSDSPEVIYIGKRIPLNPIPSGLGEIVLSAMRRRVRDEAGDGASQSLRQIDEHQLAELDEELNRAVTAWLNQHDLMPTQSKITSISEHPVRRPSMAGTGGNETD